MKGLKRILWIIAIVAVGFVVGYCIYTGVQL